MLSSLLPRRYPSSWMFSPRRDRGGGRLDVSNCLRYSSVSLFYFESKRKRCQTTKKIREGVLNRGVLSRRWLLPTNLEQRLRRNDLVLSKEKRKKATCFFDSIFFYRMTMYQTFLFVDHCFVISNEEESGKVEIIVEEKPEKPKNLVKLTTLLPYITLFPVNHRERRTRKGAKKKRKKRKKKDRKEVTTVRSIRSWWTTSFRCSLINMH